MKKFCMVLLSAVILLVLCSCAADSGKEMIDTDEIEYEYHIVLHSLNYSQMMYLVMDEGTKYASEVIYNPVKVEEVTDSQNSEEILYNVYLLLLGDIKESNDIFNKKHIPNLQQYGEEGTAFSVERVLELNR